MKASILYRIAAVLLLLFAVGHTLGFSQVDPEWHVDALVAAMRSTRFDMMGFHRSYWDLLTASGLTVGLFFLFAAVLAWQLGGLPAESLARMRLTRWAFALSFAGVALVSGLYLFAVPLAFSVAVAACLALAAWLPPR